MTQQYTPVTWQDETTSQQGTLINAERLNQMQTAHHFADGFEEVDAVPTANPGVQYHKIVYCTADSTFYRWDGTEWTADIDDETKALLQQEIARATEAEGELAQDLADETTARETADTAMQADITALQSGKLDKQTAGLNQTQVYAVRGSTQRMLTAGASSGDIPLYNIEHTLFAKMPTISLTENTVVNYGWATGQLATKADKADTYDKTAVDDLLAGKVDKDGAVTSVQGQTGAVLINAGQIPLTAGASTPTVHNAILANQGRIDAVTADLADEVQARTTAVDTLSTRVGALETGLADTYTKSQVDTLLAGYVTLNTAQTITAVKTLSKSKDVLPATIKLNDYAVGDTANAYLDGMLDENNAWIRTESVGTDSGGARGYYMKTVSVNVSGTAYNLQRRWWLTAADGFTESYLDPIKSAWRNVVTDDILDSYAPMVRTTGNQNIRGLKTCYGITIKRDTPGLDFIDTRDTSNTTTPAELLQTLLPIRANDESLNFLMQFIHSSDGSKWLQVTCFAENGAIHAYRVCGVDASGNQMNPQWVS